MNKKALRCAAVLLFAAVRFAAQEPFYPYIQALNSSDPLFKQYSQEVQENYRMIVHGETIQTSFYKYKTEKDDDLLSIAARCNIPYETIALINNVAFMDSPLANKVLYLSTCPGLFIAEKPITPLEFILKTRYSENGKYGMYTVNGSSYFFVPDERLNPTERFFFADSSMTSPLATGVISSSFGTRISPITGRKTFHGGIDIAAAPGSSVFACKSGIVAFTGKDECYGNYVILQHENNTQSLYAHLQTVLVQKGQPAVKGKQIGTVGSSGMSTGPHLHFEIRVGGRAKDPSSLIRKFLQEY